MLKNYIKITFRTLMRKRVFSLVNVLGLSIGLASVLIISAYLISELRFDSMHADGNRIYRVVERVEGGSQPTLNSTEVAGAVGVFSKSDLAGVTESVRIRRMGGLSLKYKDKELVEDYLSADANFFSFFDFPLLSGTPEGVFKDPYNVVLTESLAKKFFGEEDPIGNMISTKIRQNEYQLKVSGVMADMPENSHLNIDMLLAHNTADQFFNGFSAYYDNDWASPDNTTYLKLDQGVEADGIAAGLNDLGARNRAEDDERTHTYSLQALSDVHFRSEALDDALNYREGNLNYVYIFGCIGFIIMAVAFTNYVNLSTIKATDRIKEIGLRRAIGANRKQLIFQFMSESVLISLISLGLAFTLLQFSTPLVTLLFGSNVIGFIYLPEYMILLIASVLVLGILAGLYPAFTVLRASTVAALKNQTAGTKRQTFFKGVVLFQFVISLVMITATLVVYNQLDYMSDKDLGYDKEAVAIIEVSSDDARVNQELIVSGFKNDPNVIEASAVSRVPAEWKNYNELSVQDKEGQEYHGIPFIGVDENFISTFDIDLLSGRNFRPGSGDSLKVYVNETMAAQLGFQEVDGQVVELTRIKWGTQVSQVQVRPRFEVVGIIKDFHFQSLREEIPPMIFGYKKNPIQRIDYFVVKLNAREMGQTMARLKGVMKEFDQSPFDYNFLDDKLERYYVEDARRSKLFFIASSIAVLIAFIGLFALVHFALQKRMKEMSVRKVLGANIRSLIMLLSKDYLKLLLIAMALAAPLSYWGMSGWLNEFVYRTSVSWWIFALALLVCLAITAITALTQINKTARRNPAEILRQE